MLWEITQLFCSQIECQQPASYLPCASASSPTLKDLQRESDLLVEDLSILSLLSHIIKMFLLVPFGVFVHCHFFLHLSFF